MSRSRTTTTEPLRAHGFGPQDLLVRIPSDRPSSHPGELLREDYLPELGWSAADLAGRLHVPARVVDDVLAERAPVTPDLALRLGKLLGQTPGIWIKLQLAYDLYFALRAADADLERIVPVESPSPMVRRAS